MQFKRCEVTYTAHGRESQDLVGRSFHAAVVSDNLLYLWGGLTSEAQSIIEVINLGASFMPLIELSYVIHFADSMTAENILPSGDRPREHINGAWAVINNRMFVLGGSAFSGGESHLCSLDSVDVFDFRMLCSLSFLIIVMFNIHISDFLLADEGVAR